MPWFACATRRPISCNTGGLLSPNLGLVLHHAVMNGSVFNHFNKPSSQVSAHFWVSQSGVIEQYVDTGVVAWHGRSLNTRYVGVETEGCASSANGYADAMSDAMVDALARLYNEGVQKHGWAKVLINADGQKGFGYHRMAVATACPCDIRLNRRQDILNKTGGAAPAPAPPAPAPAPPPTSNAPAWPGRYLKYPPVMSGNDVRTWQQQMKSRGWNIGVDGSYGPQSKDVCTKFQQEKRLGVDGIVGPDTWKAAWTALKEDYG